MSPHEQTTMVTDLLNTIPNGVHVMLMDAVDRLTDFLNDTNDFPHQSIPIKSFPIQLKDSFYRFLNINLNMGNHGGYSREQLIKMDLALNPRRFDSWLTLFHLKIRQLDRIYNSIDCTR